MARCTQAVICQCHTLGHILCGEVKCHITFIMSSASMYCDLIILFMSEIDPNKSELPQFWTLLLYVPSFNCLIHGLQMNSFCLISLYLFDNTLATA